MQNKIFIVVLSLITIGLIYLLKPILTPFLAGALLAYLADPLVEKITKWHVPRILGVILVFFLLFSAFVQFSVSVVLSVSTLIV